MPSNSKPEDIVLLKGLIRILRRFAVVEHRMQVSTVLTLLETAYADMVGEEPGIVEIQQRIGLWSGTATRNVAYWAGGHKTMPSGGHKMIDMEMSATDRRRRVLKMTPKGRAFIEQLLEEIKHGETAGMSSPAVIPSTAIPG